MLDLKDDTIELVSIFTGVEYETLRNAVIINLDDILKALVFINKPPVFPTHVTKCGPYTIPVNDKGQFNIQHESLAQYEDMRSVIKKVGGNINQHTLAYGKYVAIYLQKIRDGEYQPLKVPELEDEVLNYSAYEVCTLGAFFFLKVMNFSNGSPKKSPLINPNQKKSKPVTKDSRKRSAVSPRSSKRRRN